MPIGQAFHCNTPEEEATKEEVLAFMQRNMGAFFSSNDIGIKFGLGKNAARNRLEALTEAGEIERCMDKRLVSYVVPAPAGRIGASREVDRDKPLSERYKSSMKNMYAIIEERRVK